jgi:transposase
MASRTCPGCRKLQRRVAQLEALVRDLQARLGQNASNSSLPPSANPPDAPKPVVKQPTGRKPGGQAGHPAAAPVRLPPEQVHEVIPYMPKTCRCCQRPLPEQAGPHDPEPTWHQVAELPPLAARLPNTRATRGTARIAVRSTMPPSPPPCAPTASARAWRP